MKDINRRIEAREKLEDTIYYYANQQSIDADCLFYESDLDDIFYTSFSAN